MAACSNQIIDALTPFLRSHGFLKSDQNWWRRRAEAAQIINLQRSQWGRQCYVNCAVWLNVLGFQERPIHSRCPIRFRLELLAEEKGQRVSLEKALDLDNDMTVDERGRVILPLLEARTLPMLDRWSIYENVREDYQAGRMARIAVMSPLLNL